MSASVAPVETVRSADGTVIAHRRLGRGPAVVALHGGLGSAASWAPVAERLADRYEFFLIDRRGRGHSGNGSDPHSLDREVDDARAVLHVAGAGAVLLGHSYGGAVAMETARLAAPGELAAVAVYEPAVGVGGLIAPAEIDRVDELIRAGRHGSALEHGLAMLDAAGLVTRARMSPGARRPQALLAIAWTVSRELRAADALGTDLSRFAELELPALVLAGSASPARQRRTCEDLARTLPGGEIAWLPDLGHVAHTAATDTVAAALSSFLEALPPR